MAPTLFRRSFWILALNQVTRCFIFSLICITVSGAPVLAALNGTETIITTDTTGSFQMNPSIYGDIIAWDDQRAGIGTNTVYAYNLLTGFEYPVLPDPANPYLWQTAPAVYGDWIIWQQDDSVNYNIIAFNNNTLEIIPVPAMPKGLSDTSFSYFGTPSDNVLPQTNGTAVVWQDYTNDPHWGIYLYDLSSGSGGVSDPILADPGYDQKNPAISGDYLVYENWSSGKSDIYLYFGVNKTAVRISSFSNDNLNPSVDGTGVVWQRNNETTGFNAIYLYDILTGQTLQVTPAGSLFNQVNAKIYNDLVVVVDDRDDGTMQVYAYHLDTSPPTEEWITPGSERMKINPAVFENRVIWEDYRNGIGSDSDIYLNTLGPAETCPVADFTLAPSAVLQGDAVAFSATGAQAGASVISHRLWNFSDGSPWELPPGSAALHTYSQDGVFPVTLTVGNGKCRNVSIGNCSHTVFVNSPPVADFTATPEYGLAPLRVQFSDISCGAPLNWSWDFGDGDFSLERNPSHVFSEPGMEYTVTLTVNNTNADYASSAMVKTVRTLMGDSDSAGIPLQGITFDDRFGGQFLTYDSSVLPVHSPAPPAGYLVVNPPSLFGWDNITFIASDTVGVNPASPNQTYFANISRIYLKTNDVIATTSGTPPDIGNNWGTWYQVNTSTFPKTASFRTEILEGAVPADWADFDYISTHATTPNLLRSNAYTVKITKEEFVNEGAARINMSVGSSWVASADNVYILGVGLDSAGNTRGAIIPVEHVLSAGGLEYYEAIIPENANYLSTFGLADLSGSGNPFQLITLSVTSHVNPPEPVEPVYDPSAGVESGSTTAAGAGTGRITVPPATSTPAPLTPVPPDPGTSAKVYTNANGLVTQATRLLSTNGLATVTIGEGVVAKDAGGSPLTEITLKAILPENLPEIPTGSAFTFAGIAYDLGPDGATFSLPVTITFTLPQAEWGKDYSVQFFDTKSGTWQTLPTTFDAATGTVTANVGHLSVFALFTEPRASPATPAATPLPLPSAPQVKAQPPATAVSIFANMMSWAADLVMNNAIIPVVVAILAILGYLAAQGRFPGGR